MKYLFPILLTLCIGKPLFLSAQVNLVPNPSFEDLIQCPVLGTSQLSYASPWFFPPSGTSDLFSVCANSVPYTSFGVQFPRTGETFAGGMYASEVFTDYREYVEVKLTEPLQDGKTYCVRFYVSLGDRCKYAISDIGVYFSADSCLSQSALLPYTPQVTNPINNIIDDKTGWQPIVLQYTASGDERFMTIGNFESDLTTHIIFTDSSTWTFSPDKSAYYFIDDVSVIDINTPALAGNDTLIPPGDSVFVGRPPEIGLEEHCTWYVGGEQVHSGAGMWVSPGETTTYVLGQTICGNTTYDTVTISVGYLGLDETAVFHFGVYPNPSEGQFTVQLNERTPIPATLQITDLSGKILQTIRLENHQAVVTTEVSEGIYFVRVEDIAGTACEPQKIVISR